MIDIDNLYGEINKLQLEFTKIDFTYSAGKDFVVQCGGITSLPYNVSAAVLMKQGMLVASFENLRTALNRVSNQVGSLRSELQMIAARQNAEAKVNNG
jgi:hypothetical protein